MFVDMTMIILIKFDRKSILPTTVMCANVLLHNIKNV